MLASLLLWELKNMDMVFVEALIDMKVLYELPSPDFGLARPLMEEPRWELVPLREPPADAAKEVASSQRDRGPSSLPERNPDRLPLTACTKCTKGLDGPFVRRFLTSREVPASGSIPGPPLTVCTPCTKNLRSSLPGGFIPLMRYSLW